MLLYASFADHQNTSFAFDQVPALEIPVLKFAIRMPELIHHPLCPHSRYVRLIMGELGMEVTLTEERIWERRREFLILNPAGATPVLVEENIFAIPGPDVIAEYLDETRGLVLAERRLLPEDPASRIEVRRLTDWFNHKIGRAHV